MGEITADAYSFAKGFKGSPIRPSLLIIESYMAMNEIAHRLNTCPPGRCLSKSFPGEVS